MRRSLKVKRKPSDAGCIVGREAAQHARYVHTSVYVPQSEDNDNAGWYKVSRNEDVNLLEAWITPSDGFDGSHLRAAYRCRDLWRLMPRPTHRVTELENINHARAAKRLQELKRAVDRRDWEAFENAMRFNEPGGYSGSRFAAQKPEKIAAAKEVVRRVLEAIR